MKQISKEELAKSDGKDGRPAWIAFKGSVYDVTSSPLWPGGEHQGMHEAGNELAESLESMAPHGNEVLERYPKLGTLAPG